MDTSERLVRIALLVRLIALGLTVLELAVQGPRPITALLLVALSATSFAGLKSAGLRRLVSRRPVLAVPDLLLVSAVPPLTGGDSALSLVAVSSALVIGVLFTVPAVALLVTLVVVTHAFPTSVAPAELLDSAGVPVTLVSVAAMGVAFRRVADRQVVLERLAADAQVAAVAAEERLRLARDVHDTVAKTCQGIALSAAALPQWLWRDPEAAARLAADIGASARDGVAMARRILVSLRIDDPAQSLPEAVVSVVGRVTAASDLTVRCRVDEVPPVTPTVRHELLLALSEALDNAVRHAPGSTVTVRLAAWGDEVAVEVTDDGPGWAAGREEEAVLAGRFGLAGMRERMAAVGGRAVVTSSPRVGTRVTLCIPVHRPPRPRTDGHVDGGAAGGRLVRAS